MNLVNHFLVAMPGLTDGPFERSVIYICEHNKEGAMGIIVNAPINLTIGGMLDKVDVDSVHPRVHKESLQATVLSGGPVSEDRGFILHEPKDSYQSSIQMTEHISVTTSKDILSVLGTEAEPKHYIVALGYAGWTAGQLENELAENSWLTVEADPEVIYQTPIEERWQAAVKMLGVEPSQLSINAGHA
ncbi:YqgE/AlgH family protein [Vibrio sp. TH_r3]|uniref:YqgE/AlgH family protein n=1 Tax=unclassified Vibrio TaxID=2614977 RepID=UPI002952AD00|nr:YqgE/AlgH family protein [Vibrio sp. TH_r3]MDV7106291.1 YqgE/AlgH family protein [Vibrio sp. TH_r3]